MKRFVLVLLFPAIVFMWMVGFTLFVTGNRRKVDPDQLQHLDELNGVWVREWRRKVQK